MSKFLSIRNDLLELILNLVPEKAEKSISRIFFEYGELPRKVGPYSSKSYFLRK